MRAIETLIDAAWNVRAVIGSLVTGDSLHMEKQELADVPILDGKARVDLAGLSDNAVIRVGYQESLTTSRTTPPTLRSERVSVTVRSLVSIPPPR